MNCCSDISPGSSLPCVLGLCVASRCPLGRLLDLSHLPPARLQLSALDLVSAIDAHMLLFTFLPPLIFESAFSIDASIFQRMWKQMVMLAGPGESLSYRFDRHAT